MTTPRKTITTTLIVLVAVAIAAAAIFGLLRPRPSASPTVVRIGYLPIYVDLPLFVAKEMGYFQRHGVDVELVRFASSPDIGTAIVTGDINFGASIAYSVALGIESRDPGKIKVFIVDSETPDNYLSSFVVLSDSGIKTIADLKGKKVASFPGPTAVTFGKLVLEKYGLNPEKDLEFIELDVASHLSALESKTVDAIFTYEPTGTQAVIEKNAIKILPGAVEREIINPWQAGVWIASSSFYSSHPTDARAVIQSLYDAVDYIRSEPAKAKLALSPYTSIKANVAQATPSIPFAKLDEIDLSAFQRHADILRSRGVISKQLDSRSLLAPGDWVRR